MTQVAFLIYTSAPRGLKPGTTGFCTVAMTAGLNPDEAQQLEMASAYAFHFDPFGPQAAGNTINWSHWITVSGRHVLSRIAPCRADHTGRSNFLAQHILLPHSTAFAAGPAQLLASCPWWRTEWTEEPRWLAPCTLDDAPPAEPRPCRAWEEMAGDAGWAGELLRLLHVQQARSLVVIVPPDRDALAMLRDMESLLPPVKRWSLTFATSFGEIPPGARCALRFVPAGSRVADQLASLQVIDLSHPRPCLAASPWVEAARQGIIVPLEQSTGKVVARRAAQPAPSPAVAVPSTSNMPKPIEDEGLSPPPRGSPARSSYASRSRRRDWWKVLLVAVALVIVAGGLFAWWSTDGQVKGLASSVVSAVVSTLTGSEARPATGATASTSETETTKSNMASNGTAPASQRSAAPGKQVSQERSQDAAPRAVDPSPPPASETPSQAPSTDLDQRHQGNHLLSSSSGASYHASSSASETTDQANQQAPAARKVNHSSAVSETAPDNADKAAQPAQQSSTPSQMPTSLSGVECHDIRDPSKLTEIWPPESAIQIGSSPSKSLELSIPVAIYYYGCEMRVDHERQEIKFLALISQPGMKSVDEIVVATMSRQNNVVRISLDHQQAKRIPSPVRIAAKGSDSKRGSIWMNAFDGRGDKVKEALRWAHEKSFATITIGQRTFKLPYRREELIEWNLNDDPNYNSFRRKAECWKRVYDLVEAKKPELNQEAQQFGINTKDWEKIKQWLTTTSASKQEDSKQAEMRNSWTQFFLDDLKWRPQPTGTDLRTMYWRFTPEELAYRDIVSATANNPKITIPDIFGGHIDIADYGFKNLQQQAGQGGLDDRKFIQFILGF